MPSDAGLSSSLTSSPRYVRNHRKGNEGGKLRTALETTTIALLNFANDAPTRPMGTERDAVQLNATQLLDNLYNFKQFNVE